MHASTLRRLNRFSTDSPPEEDGFEPPVPLGSNTSVSTGFASWRGGRSLFRKAPVLRGGPAVRIRLPPATSQQRTGEGVGRMARAQGLGGEGRDGLE